MLTINEAIEYLISDQIHEIKIKKTNILKNRTIITMDHINTINHNIIECFLFYLKDYINNFDNNTDIIYESFIKFLRLKIKEKNFIKSLNIDLPTKKQLYLKSADNHFNDCFGILFISQFLSINVIIVVDEKNYIINDNTPIDHFKPFIILVYYQNDNIFLPTFQFGNKDITLNHIQFSKILKETTIININLRNANTKIISIEKPIEENLSINSDTSLIDSESSDDIDDEVKELISKTDSQLMKEKKELLLTVIGRLKLYKKGYENKKKADLVSIIRTY
jgi:hypothetical protein